MEDEKKVFSFSSAELNEAEELNSRTDTRMTEEYKEFLRQHYGGDDDSDAQEASGPGRTGLFPEPDTATVDTDSEEFLAETDFTFDYEDECPSHGTDYDHSDDYLSTETYIAPGEDYVEIDTGFPVTEEYVPEETDYETEEDYFKPDPDYE